MYKTVNKSVTSGVVPKSKPDRKHKLDSWKTTSIQGFKLYTLIKPGAIKLIGCGFLHFVLRRIGMWNVLCENRKKF